MHLKCTFIVHFGSYLRSRKKGLKIKAFNLSSLTGEEKKIAQ